MSLWDKTLAKLTIQAYRDVKLSQSEHIGGIVAMYNPSELTLNYAAMYDDINALNDVSNVPTFQDAPPGTLDLQLIFDSHLPGHRTPIDAQIAAMKRICGIVNGTTRETHYLKVTWGKFNWVGDGYFAGRMQNLSVRYTLFDRDGSPLRATANLSLLEDRDPYLEEQKRKQADRLPTKTVTTNESDLLTVAHSTAGGLDAIEIARHNKLDDLGAPGAGTLKLPVVGGEKS